MIDGPGQLKKPAIRRLARRAGVKRISGDVYQITQGAVYKFVGKVVRDAMTVTEHAKKSTIQPSGLIWALKNNGLRLYGHGGK